MIAAMGGFWERSIGLSVSGSVLPRPRVAGLIVVVLDVFCFCGDVLFCETESFVVTFCPNSAIAALLPEGARGQALVSADNFFDGL